LKENTNFQDWSNYNKPKNNSAIWTILLYESKCIVGNGSSIDLCHDPWITTIPLVRWPTFLNPDMYLDDLPVSSLNTNDKECEAMIGVFYEDLIKMISSIIPLSLKEVKDSFWSSGGFPDQR